MARPLSPEKCSALLLSATRAVAEQGVLATTAAIARSAGVAEGTLFTYFESKDVLFQALYRHLKQSLADTVMPGFPEEADYRERLQHIFQHYVDWGLANRTGRLALSRLIASGQILESTRAEATAPFHAAVETMEDAVRDGVLVDAPISFLYSIIEHIADTTIEYVDRHPAQAGYHRQLGFDSTWRALTR